jgi:hypothetical protein
MNRNIKRSVIAGNVLMTCIVLITKYRQYRYEEALARLLGNTKIGLLAYAESHAKEMASLGFVVAILLCGVVLEARKSKAAIFINFGSAVLFLLLILVNWAISWNQISPEEETVLILIAVPLLAMTLVYAFAYREDLRAFFGRRWKKA